MKNKNTDKERQLPRIIRDYSLPTSIEFDNGKLKSFKGTVSFNFEITIDNKGIRHLFIKGKEQPSSSGEIKCILDRHTKNNN
jgi:hypothetical protein